jgi:hypothetical protein
MFKKKKKKTLPLDPLLLAPEEFAHGARERVWCVQEASAGESIRSHTTGCHLWVWGSCRGSMNINQDPLLLWPTMGWLIQKARQPVG